MPQETILIYPRGKIILQTNQVSQVNWLSDSEFKAQQDLLKQQQETWLQRERQAAQRKLEAGNRLRDDRLTNPDFIASPLHQQIAFWRNFKKAYPEIDIEPEFSNLVAKYKNMQLELQQAQQEIQLTQLKKSAERQAQKAETPQTPPQQASFIHTGTYTPAPLWFHNPSPTIIIHRTSPHLSPNAYPPVSLQKPFHTYQILGTQKYIRLNNRH